MTAEPLLTLAASLLAKHKLDAVLIGNAAAALQGAPVTTLDLDFMFVESPANLRKLRGIARDLGGSVLRPYYPASSLFRVSRDSDGLQLDFMAKIDGIRSFRFIRSRASVLALEKHSLLVASLSDVIKSKAAAGRPQDRAVLPLLRATLRETKTEA
jgi:hypothetical protein